MNADAELVAQKQAIRAQALANRNAQPDRDALSARIWQRLVETPEYRSARSILFYVDARTEVRTRPHLPDTLADFRAFVPYCVEGELELFHLTSMDELVAGAYRIPEPKPELRSLPARKVEVGSLDLIVVPGVAFDRKGARLGHGFGYYDRLLKKARPETPLVGLAFECQLFEAIPTEPHDVFLDLLITEQAVYRCRYAGGRRGE